MTTKALLLAGGRGERLLPITASTPKCLVPVGPRTLLEYWVAELVRAGVREAVINTHHLADRVRDKIRELNRVVPLVLRESYEPSLLGSAGTVTNNRRLADGADDIVLIYTDNLSDASLTDLLRFHRGHGQGRSMLLFRAPQPEACGIATLDSSGTVVEFVEKPKAPKSNLANAGIYVFSAQAYRELADGNAFDIGADVLPRLVGKIRGHEHVGYHLDIGTHEALARARADIQRLALEGFMTRAVFLDRDGTLIESVHYLNRPEQVRLLPGVVSALRDWKRMGYLCIVVTNQAAVSKGLLSIAVLEQIHARLRSLLAAGGATLHAIYFSTEPQLGSNRRIVEHWERKPGPGLLFRAASEHHLSLNRSWMIGDQLSDMLAGRNADCEHTVLVRASDASALEHECSSVDFVVANLPQAVRLMQARASSENRNSERSRSCR